jgi:formate/nitrite transporter FocA (FNT family)
MFYFSLAGDFSALMLKSLVVITIGNSIGGGLIPLAWRFAPTRG